MGSRRSAFVASGIILTIVAAIIVTCWLRYRPPAPIVAIIPETTAQELWESEHAGVAATIARTPWGTYWNGPSSEHQVAQQIALVPRNPILTENPRHLRVSRQVCYETFNDGDCRSFFFS